MKNQKEQLRNQSHSPLQKKNRTSRNETKKKKKPHLGMRQKTKNKKNKPCI